MYKKIGIVLFVTIFCNGVTFSSPTKENVPELTPKKPTVSTEVTNQTNHMIEHSTTAPDNGAHHAEIPAVETSSNHSEADGKNISRNSTIVEKSINQGSNIKSDTQNNTVTSTKNPNASLDNSTPKPTTHNSTALPVINSNTVTDLPLRTFSDMSRPIEVGQSTTTVTTLAAGATPTAPVTKPAVTTPTTTPAVSTSTENVLLEHNSASKTQENRFDGASFVGGIVLTIGLTAIGFIAFKYYKSGKIDGNYRTL